MRSQLTVTDGEVEAEIARIAECSAEVKFTSAFPSRQREIDVYNREAPLYVSKYADYLRDLRCYDNLHTRRVLLQLLVWNESPATATDVDVFLSFPNSLSLLTSEKDLKRPDPPSPPELPLSDEEFAERYPRMDIYGVMNYQHQALYGLFPFGRSNSFDNLCSSMYGPTNSNSEAKRQPEVSPLNITDNSNARIHLRRLKSMPEFVCPIIVAEFNSLDDIRHFTISAKVNAMGCQYRK